MTPRVIIGWSWVLGGISIALADSISLGQLAMDPKYGWGSAFFKPSWWSIQIAMLLFLAGCAVIGAGIAAAKRWALVGLRVAGPIALLYLVAYDIFGGERSWWLGMAALLLTILVAVSVLYAYNKASQLAA